MVLILVTIFITVLFLLSCNYLVDPVHNRRIILVGLITCKSFARRLRKLVNYRARVFLSIFRQRCIIIITNSQMLLFLLLILLLFLNDSLGCLVSLILHYILAQDLVILMIIITLSTTILTFNVNSNNLRLLRLLFDNCFRDCGRLVRGRDF